MTSQLELASHGHWLNWDLYSEEALNEEQQVKYLNIIRDNIKKDIHKDVNKDYLYVLDLHLYLDKTNNKIYKLSVYLSNMSNRNIVDVDLKHDHDYYAGGGEASLAITGVHPTPPKGYLNSTPFTRILHDMVERAISGAIVKVQKSH